MAKKGKAVIRAGELPQADVPMDLPGMPRLAPKERRKILQIIDRLIGVYQFKIERVTSKKDDDPDWQSWAAGQVAYWRHGVAMLKWMHNWISQQYSDKPDPFEMGD